MNDKECAEDLLKFASKQKELKVIIFYKTKILR